MAGAGKNPLEMNGVQVRDIGALKENFDIEKVLEYFQSGELAAWLEARYYEDEAEAVEALDISDSELAQKLCSIFGVACSMDAETLAERNERIARLRQYTDDDEIIRNVDSVAFDQEDLAELYDRGAEVIWLCEGTFRIPKSKRSLTYTLIGGASAAGLEEQLQAACPEVVEPVVEMKMPEPPVTPKRSVGITCDPDDLEDLMVYDDIEIDEDEEELYLNKNIHFHAVIECSGSLRFVGCVLHCGEDDDGGIVINEGGELALENCKIVGHKDSDEEFIDMEEGSKPTFFQACEFVNVSYLMDASADVTMKNCRIVDAGPNSMCLERANASFEECEFLFLKKRSGDNDWDDAVIDCSSSTFIRCTIKGRLNICAAIDALPSRVEEDLDDWLGDVVEDEKGNGITMLVSEKCKITDCSITGTVLGVERVRIKNSSFDNVFLMIDGGGGTIVNCTLESCVAYMDGDIETEASRFTGCLIVGEQDDSCEYENCKYADFDL